MANLVSEHARELVHPLNALNEAAIDVDVATRYRKGVHLGRIDDEELPVEAAVVSQPGD